MLEPFGTEPNWPFGHTLSLGASKSICIHKSNWVPISGNVRIESGTGNPVLEELEPEQPIARMNLVEPEQISTHRGLISISRMSRRDRHDGHRFSKHV